MLEPIDKFNIVDMGGIDVVKSQGLRVEGLFTRLLNSIQNCKYTLLTNWNFAEIPIVPTYVELVFDDEEVKINDLISVTSEDIVRVYSLEKPVEPVTTELIVAENGTYVPEEGVDGFSKVYVNVQATQNQLNFHSGRLEIDTGAISEDDEYCYSDLVPIDSGSGWWYLDLSRSELSSYYTGVCLYAEDGVTLVDYIRQYVTYRSYNNDSFNAKFFRIANKKSNMSFASLSQISEGIRIFPEDSVNYVIKGE